MEVEVLLTELCYYGDKLSFLDGIENTTSVIPNNPLVVVNIFFPITNSVVKGVKYRSECQRNVNYR